MMHCLSNETDSSLLKNPRFDTVSSLRGFAILTVLLRHFDLSFQLTKGFFEFLPSGILTRLTGNGDYGVVMFFAVSGFLITNQAKQRFGSLGSLSLKQFYILRAARILPTMALMTGLVVVLASIGIDYFQNRPGSPTMVTTVFAISTFTFNLLVMEFGYFNRCLSVLWSLSVEEVFYLTFPLICLALKKENGILCIWILLLLVGPAYRYVCLTRTPPDGFRLYNYIACLDGIAIGSIAAILRTRLNFGAYRRRIFCLSIAGLWLAFFTLGGLNDLIFGPSLISVLTALVVLSMDAQPRVTFFDLLLRPVRWLGQRCYEIYLFHAIVLAFLCLWVGGRSVTLIEKPVLLITFLGLSAGIGEAIQAWFSNPLNSYLRKSFDANLS